MRNLHVMTRGVYQEWGPLLQAGYFYGQAMRPILVCRSQNTVPAHSTPPRLLELRSVTPRFDTVPDTGRPGRLKSLISRVETP